MSTQAQYDAVQRFRASTERDRAQMEALASRPVSPHPEASYIMLARMSLFLDTLLDEGDGEEMTGRGADDG